MYDYTSSQNIYGGRYVSDDGYSFNTANKFFKSDILSCASMSKINTEFYKDDGNDIHRRVISKVLRELGRVRVELNTVPQKEVSVFEIVSELYSDKKIAKKLASKENLSVPGRVDNFFREHINNEIITLVRKHALKL